MEFIYYDKEGLDLPISESILVSNHIDNSKKYIVSNSDEIDSYIKAKEVNFYLNNTLDTLADQIDTVEKIYSIKSTIFDYDKQIDRTKEVNNSLLIVSDDESLVDKYILEFGENFDFYAIKSEQIETITGSIGNLTVSIKGKQHPLTLDQIVMIDKDKEYLLSGITYAKSSNLQESIDKVKNNLPFEYSESISYDSSCCDFDSRFVPTCGKCAEVCPSSTILKNLDTKKLEFTHENCIACGKCASICPSGAIEYTKVSDEAIENIAQSLKNKILMLTTNRDLRGIEGIDLKANIIPIALDSINFLDESSLVTLLQQSGANIIIYSNKISSPLKNSIKLLNDIYEKVLDTKAIYYIDSIENLQSGVDSVKVDERFYFDTYNTNKSKKEIFASRVSQIVKSDLGVIDTELSYGDMSIDKSKCTLCLACVGECKSGALSINQKELTLSYNPSLCTTCSFCIVACPEKDCISLEYNKLSLNPSWFAPRVMAKDELFACVECGKEFATKKSIEKVASMMGVHFMGDELKTKTLYCCSDCKAKLMVQGVYDGK
jgi:ferredoxin